jgi:hypothetical protein
MNIHLPQSEVKMRSTGNQTKQVSDQLKVHTS